MGKPEEEIVEHPSFVYSSINRILHWIRAIVIIGLIVTGFYIAEPFLTSQGSTDKLLYAEWTKWHLILGFILIASGILRIYLFFFGKDTKGELGSLKDLFSLKSWITQLKAYFFIGELKKKGFYGPLQFLTYTAIMVLVVLASLTGLILYVHVYHLGIGGWLYEPMRVLEVWMGGLANVRYIHHITVWGYLIFLPIHIYLVIWSAIRFKHGAMDVMFTGYDYHLRKEKLEKEKEKVEKEKK
ncbi:Ni/Fe-hydrogenase, b-type cytochrome subunit [Sulfurovum sp. XGS-02]|uniref:Ni/Fe-hydrogenase, b-type cytochrome subunit n=1 Tax=Sulfurovum sp. XGS-02 TaxID=2925411 RepID=UPI002047C676|nr:Ni/Fe-hydrogenase, b-type cytochrome subunit [Sulfurovum sp. XGS-02]UPT78468.1 Ni/Fe-hydrogenase, b-type cytochrome subunit [Sulfurovum sp. XGS-02]